MAGLGQGARPRTGGCCCRCWLHILDFFLTLWVLRVPFATVVVGGLLMWWVPQAQDLLIELAMPGSAEGWLRIVTFFALLLFVWAMPAHYAARLLITSDERFRLRLARRRTAFMKGLQTWMPRILGVLTVCVMLGGVYRAGHNVPIFSDTTEFVGLGLRLWIVASGLFITGAVFLLYAVYRQNLAATPLVAALEASVSIIMLPLRGLAPAVTRRVAGGSQLGPLLLLLLFVCFAFLPMFFTLWFSETFPRLLSIPFVLGGWLPLLAYLSGLGRRFHAPLILASWAIVSLLPLVTGDNYAIRRILAPGTVQGRAWSEQVELTDAIKWWRAKNCTTASCPRPIIIAAAGGASRAGFFTAGVIGQLLDDQLKLNGKGHGLTSEQMANRIFALSTVSGSSIGAVMTVAAIASSANGVQPCTNDAQPLWDGNKVTSWRSCLEALTAGDFLTPIFTGFVFRDIFGFLKWADRGTLLERSIELHFAGLVTAVQNPAKLSCVGALDCGFMTLRPTADSWVPLLFLNSTSVKTGQRVVTALTPWHVDFKDPARCPNSIREESCEVFLRGANFYDWQGAAPNPERDLRLSTAAHNSARFPLLSPPGSITDANGRIVDRLVDGGYFENFGAQTAAELASAIKALDADLNPFILILSNDPQVVKPKPGVPPTNTGSGSTFLPDLVDPLTAFANTRNARGVLAVEGAAVKLDHLNAKQCNTAWLRVWAEPDVGKENARELSMSWWLSKPVQRYLREQTEFVDGQPKNKHQNAPRIQQLLDALANTSLPDAKPGEVQCLQDEEEE